MAETDGLRNYHVERTGKRNDTGEFQGSFSVNTRDQVNHFERGGQANIWGTYADSVGTKRLGLQFHSIMFQIFVMIDITIPVMWLSIFTFMMEAPPSDDHKMAKTPRSIQVYQTDHNDIYEFD